ncbi:hypothetical protein D3C87_2168150 [compost metagenome]
MPALSLKAFRVGEAMRVIVESGEVLSGLLPILKCTRASKPTLDRRSVRSG